jgi:acetyl-CoA carboxylase biotin carboxylase subunit
MAFPGGWYTPVPAYPSEKLQLFKKILIANRGEIALRIIRACRDLGVRTVAVYSEADRTSMHVLFADEAYPIGPAAPRLSYLDIERILGVARESGAKAIHPGYGLLAENPDFADACAAAGIRYIGPTARAQRLAAEKTAARRTMRANAIPIIPGTMEPVADDAEAIRAAEEIGYPLVVKAEAGGGGKGMRVARSPEELAQALRLARGEVAQSFGKTDVYLERQVSPARHIEIQLLADEHGHVVHLGERECSVQRRHQKLIEESPSPVVDADLRRRLGEAAVRAARAVGYTNAGTAEFLLDDQGNYYFLEMNARLQVEHPVTELVTGIDIVKEQLRLANGEPLGYGQEAISQRGHSIECRVYAEDPFEGFLPSLGVIGVVQQPDGPHVRVESAAHSHMAMPLEYDPLISKLIVWGNTRADAIRTMARALREYYITGVRTTIPFHQFVMRNAAFIKGDFDTDFVRKEWHQADHAQDSLREAAAVAATLLRDQRGAPSGAGGRRPAPVAGNGASAWRTSARWAAMRKG